MHHKGKYFSLLLHAHLPYVHHPEYPSYLEENWLFEAISETYIPLLQLLESLEKEQIPWSNGPIVVSDITCNVGSS